MIKQYGNYIIITEDDALDKYVPFEREWWVLLHDISFGPVCISEAKRHLQYLGRGDLIIRRHISRSKIEKL